MRFPWLQVDVDFIGSRSKDLAALLRVSRREAIGLAIDLWSWVLGRSAGDGPPDGIVRGRLGTVEVLIAGGVDWAGDVKHLVISLETSGLLEYVDGGVRVRGMSRYRATWEKNRRRHGTGEEPERNRSGSPPEPVRKTQTQTQTQKEEGEDIPPPSSAASEGGVEVAPGVWQFTLKPKEQPRRVRTSKPEKPTDPRHAPLVKALVEEVGFPFDGPKDAAHVKGLLALADQQEATRGELAPAEVMRRARIAWGQFPGFNSARTLGDFRSHWGRFAEATTRSTGPPDGLAAVPPDACAGCGSRGQGGSVGEPEVWLVYECGCLPAFTEAQSKGLHFTKAAEWAAKRRAA